MQKIMIKFLMWFLVATIAMPAIILTSAGSAHAATKSVSSVEPMTELITSPKHANENGWFNKVTLVKLQSNEGNETYFQWNGTNGTWTEYKQAFRAWRGENILYYYSVNSQGIKEAIKSQIIKVDYTRPENSVVSAKSEKAQAKLAWEDQTDVTAYRISKKNGNIMAIVSSEPPYFIDQDVKIGKTYHYKLKAVDQAGLKSKAIKASVTVVPYKMVKTIEPAIGSGKSIQIAGQTESEINSVKTEKVEPIVEIPPVVTPEQPPIKNWNRLFIALSILIIAAGAAIAGYYGYEWWVLRRENSEEKNSKKTNNRW